MTKYLMCIYGGHMCMCIPHMKFLCLTLWQGEVCTDDDDDDANAGQSMIDKALVDKPNEPKDGRHMGLHILRVITPPPRQISGSATETDQYSYKYTLCKCTS